MQPSPASQRNQVLLAIAAVLILVTLCAELFLQHNAKQLASQSAVKHGELILRQTSLLARPLLLANDRISLNYLLNELTSLPYIRAAELHTKDQGTVARAGEAGGIQMQQALSPAQNSHLTVWLDPKPLTASLHKQQLFIAAFAVAGLLLLIIVVMIVMRRPPESQLDNLSDETTSPSTESPMLEGLHAPTNNDSDNHNDAFEPVESTDAGNFEPTPSEQHDDKPPFEIDGDDDALLDPEAELEQDVQDPMDTASIEEEAAAAARAEQQAEQLAQTLDQSADENAAPLEQQEPAQELTLEEPAQTPDTGLTARSMALDEPAETGDPVPMISDYHREAQHSQTETQPSLRAEREDDQDNEVPFIDQLHTDQDDQNESLTRPEADTSTAAPVSEPTTSGSNTDENTDNTDSEETSTAETTKTNLDTDSLVSLLKPPQERAPQIPQFQPSSAPAEQAEEKPAQPASKKSQSPADSYELQEQDLERKPAKTTSLEQMAKIQRPLKEPKTEEQLNLYSFEHELELVLDGKDAAYCLFIDISAHAGNMEDEERKSLLKIYVRLAGQAAAIYSGQIFELGTGDLVIRFNHAQDNDGHGINAVCCALLFNLLYKGFNESRIRAFQPALNLHMALTRGKHTKPDMLLEEARFLTRTTQSNDLISHTALTEIPALKKKLLANADIRREDEDKVLLLKLSGNIQELLQKQANHLLRKLQS